MNQIAVQSRFRAELQWVTTAACLVIIQTPVPTSGAEQTNSDLLLPTTPIQQVRDSREQLPLGCRVKVVGTATFKSPADSGLFIRDQTGNLYLEGALPDPKVQVGDLVEAVGDVQADASSRKLIHCQYRVLGKGEQILPRAVTGDQLKGGAFDMEVVHFKARLMTVPILHADAQILQTMVDRVPVNLLLLGDTARSLLSQLRPGTLLDVTGVCSLGPFRQGRPVSIRVYLRSEHEVEVLRGPPWWTRERIAGALALLLAIGVAAVGWLLVLRHRDRERAFELRMTERSKAEEAVRKSERRYRELFNSIDEGFCVVQVLFDQNGMPVDWQYLEANPGFEKHSTLRGVTGKTHRELVSNIETRWLEILGRIATSGEPVRQVDFSQTTQRWVDLYAFRIGGPAEHKVAILFRDITERKQTEMALQRLAAIVESSEDAILSKTLDGTILSWNRSAERMFGYSAAEAIGKPATILIPPERRTEQKVILKRMQAGEVIEHFETVRVTKAGRKIDVSLTLSPIRDGKDRIVAVSKILRDIRVQKEAQRVLERSKEELERLVAERTAKLEETVGELEHFSYTITHDMRAPLRAMQGFGELLLKDCAACLNPNRRVFLERIAKAAERMDHLIIDALDYSKVVKEDHNLEPVDTDALLRGMLETYPQFQAPAVQIEILGPIPRVLGNQSWLTQCFSNLIDNAVKFVRPGQRPRVQIRPESENGQVRLWFIDNGIGIPNEYHEKIWGMFQRLNTSYEGTGIGLALVRKIVARMGGTSGVESEPDNGSRFWVELKASSPLRVQEISITIDS